MAELISVPLKKPTDVDVVQPLKNTINIIYSTSQKAQDYTEQVNELSKLRKNAVWKAYEKYESSLEVIYSYYDQLIALESKIPPGELQIPFKWKDAFSKGSGLFGGRTSLTISQLGYERVCVLFNIAALQSSVAASQSMDSDEGLKLAAKLFQQSAGIFSHLKGNVMAALQQDPTPDLNPDTLAALSSLMLAQAQEIFVHKAIHDNLKDALTAKLANQAEELYADALKLLQKENVRPLWDKEWIPIVAGKQAMFHGVAEFFQSLVCKSNKAVGEEIARLQSAIEYLKAAQTRSGKPGVTADIIAKAERHLKEALKDNDFIYHERIPDAKSLTPIGRAPLAKAQSVPPKLSSNFKDLFEQLVPMAVHQALTAYENHKSELVNSEVAKLRDATQLLNSVLASLNLPAALEDTSGQELPPSLVSKASAVQERGGITAINNMLRELPDLLTRNREILDETERMLNDEKQSDDQLRDQFKDKWNRIPSSRLTETFRTNMEKYRTILNNAAQADKTVRDKYEAHKRGMELLSEGPAVMAASVPHAGGASPTNSNSSSAGRLRLLMDQVETMKAERDAIECELKSASVDMKETFLAALHDGNINEHALTVETLGRAYGPLQHQVKDSLNKQEGILAEIQKTNTDFVAERSGQGHAAQRREAVLKELAAAHDAYMELMNNLQEGTKFYNSLTEILLAFQNKVSDFCFARKTEKEELMKDLTRGLGAVAQAVAPNLPQHHGGVSGITSDGKKEPPPRPPPPTTSAAQLPYPVGPQNMPIPYAPGPQAPYPQYPMPTMPAGYYTLPFPSGYQAPPQQYPGYPPPQYPQYHPQYPPPQGQQPPQNPQW
ncbi:programmed cell death 6-interacting protein isoform X2 [Macrosteles quadrilineatus]|uniref:programmed cell death 6-interacting protein isoform X2 n=1 Tax=Macrosteles quadrilineatus TaxID=74068 RepID=UPI0023E16613|nr:programmed cell death 6-interacting protein isoform X2 [Macrosteles quadrilineatus]